MRFSLRVLWLFLCLAPAAQAAGPVISRFSPTSGNVDFGGVRAATPYPRQATTLRVVVPAGAKSGPITVGNGAARGKNQQDFEAR